MWNLDDFNNYGIIPNSVKSTSLAMWWRLGIASSFMLSSKVYQLVNIATIWVFGNENK